MWREDAAALSFAGVSVVLEVPALAGAPDWPADCDSVCSSSLTLEAAALSFSRAARFFFWSAALPAARSWRNLVHPNHSQLKCFMMKGPSPRWSASMSSSPAASPSSKASTHRVASAPSPPSPSALQSVQDPDCASGKYPIRQLAHSGPVWPWRHSDSKPPRQTPSLSHFQVEVAFQ